MLQMIKYKKIDPIHWVSWRKAKVLFSRKASSQDTRESGKKRHQSQSENRGTECKSECWLGALYVYLLARLLESQQQA